MPSSIYYQLAIEKLARREDFRQANACSQLSMPTMTFAGGTEIMIDLKRVHLAGSSTLNLVNLKRFAVWRWNREKASEEEIRSWWHATYSFRQFTARHINATLVIGWLIIRILTTCTGCCWTLTASATAWCARDVKAISKFILLRLPSW